MVLHIWCKIIKCKVNLKYGKYIYKDTTKQDLQAYCYNFRKRAKNIAGLIRDYLGTIPENQQKFADSAEAESLTSAVKSELETNAPLAERLLGVVRYLRTNQYKFPIKMTLLVRNFHALQKFAEAAGFNSLEESMSYNP